VLIRYKLEIASVDLRDLLQAGLEVLLRFALYAAVLNEGSVAVSALLTSDSNKFVDVAREVGRASRIQAIAQLPSGNS